MDKNFYNYIKRKTKGLDLAELNKLRKEIDKMLLNKCLNEISTMYIIK